MASDLFVPGFDKPPAQAGIGPLEVEYQVEPPRTLESSIDQVEGAVGGEDKHDSLIHTDAIERGEEHGLVVCLLDRFAVAKGLVHIVKENNAAALDGEEGADLLDAT